MLRSYIEPKVNTDPIAERAAEALQCLQQQGLNIFCTFLNTGAP